MGGMGMGLPLMGGLAGGLLLGDALGEPIRQPDHRLLDGLNGFGRRRFWRRIWRWLRGFRYVHFHGRREEYE